MARVLIKPDLAIKALQPQDQPYRVNNGKGLFILINPNGSKYWRLNYSFQGKRIKLSFRRLPRYRFKKKQDRELWIVKYSF